MRTNEDVFVDEDLAIGGWPSRTPVEVSEDGSSQTDCAVVPYRHILGVQLVDVNELADPDVLADSCAAISMKPWPKTGSPGDDKGDLVQQSRY